MPGTFWGLMTIVGPILLGLALLWAILHNRRSSREKAETERATRELYERQDREDKELDAGRD
jgi:hypothetical protein